MSLVCEEELHTFVTSRDAFSYKDIEIMDVFYT